MATILDWLAVPWRRGLGTVLTAPGLIAEGALDWVTPAGVALDVAWATVRPGGCLVMTAATPADRDALHAAALTSGAEVVEDEGGLLVARRRSDGAWVYRPWWRRVRNCLVIRYGGLGDALMASSILPALKADGWHVTVNTGPEGEAVLRHDPHVDAWIVQDRDQVAMGDLPAYWAALATRFDRVINLTESVEASLLKVPGRLDFFWPDAARRLACGVNYLEQTHAIADVSYEGPRQRFHPTADEVAQADALVARHRPLVLWVLGGSAEHKVWPWTPAALVRLLAARPDVTVALAGGPDCAELARSALAQVAAFGGDRDRLLDLVGRQDVRAAMALATRATLVVGPETGLLNAAACEANAKVVLLSHSSAVNLTRDWTRTTALAPAPEAAPCQPCHRLHPDTSHCPRHASGFALCAATIPVDAVVDAVLAALDPMEVAHAA
ncbi:glycosyltransferase family 9 protein [Zavarzinia sp. CC-PAN008]|uniref:glycosyltransferase family 9 protein n=1 Tax=Zavarzinia sp. CC-PAN008 TaxID=3243332 RepID=UPI003F749790